MRSTVPGWKPLSAWFFLHFPSMLIALEAMSSGLLFANQFEDFNYYIWNWDTDSNSKANSPLHYMWHPMLIHQYAGYQIAFQYYSHSVSYWKSETSISSRHTTTSEIWSVRLQYIWFRGDIDKYGRDWYRRVPNSARKAVDHRTIYATRSVRQQLHRSMQKRQRISTKGHSQLIFWIILFLRYTPTLAPVTMLSAMSSILRIYLQPC